MSAGPRRIGAAAVGVALGLAVALAVVTPASVSPGIGAAGPVAASASPWYPAWLRPDDPDTAGLDRGCSRSLVRAVLGSFFDAFNRRDQQALAGLFGPDFGPAPGGFSILSVSNHSGDSGSRPGPFQTYDPRELPSYFVSRWAQNERWVLRELRIREDSTVGPATAWFQIAYDRTADDLPASFIAGGKGGISCAERTIRVWAMGDHAPWGP